MWIHASLSWGRPTSFDKPFKVNTNGSGYSLLFAYSNATFSAVTGLFPGGKLVEAVDGRIYGGTYAGGANGDGVIFRINKDGSAYNLLHSFNDNIAEGVDDLVSSADGMLYGAAGFGGLQDSGALYKISTNGSGFTVIRQFTGSGGDGSVPNLIEGTDGKLYGTATIYNADMGRVFSMDKNGSNYTTLHAFTGTGGDGSFPNGVIEADSLLYGTTGSGGSNDVGTIFKIGKDGSGYTVLYHFNTTGGGGYYPSASVVRGSDGNFYGNTTFGGDLNVGTIYRLSGAAVVSPPTIQFSVQPGNLLQLSWPSNYLGWKLQAQTNAPAVGLTGSWSTITNSAFTNWWTLPINPAVGSVFLRLVPP